MAVDKNDRRFGNIFEFFTSWFTFLLPTNNST